MATVVQPLSKLAAFNDPSKPFFSQFAQAVGSTGAKQVQQQQGGAPTQQAAPQPTGPNNQDILNQIDEIYNSSFDYLNQAENALRSDLPNVLKSAQSNYDTNASVLNGQKQNADNQFGFQSNQAGTQNQNALSDSRNLYNELQTGYQQRFGGSSSAGEAAYQLAGREQQRQQGQLAQQYNTTLQQIGMQKADVQSKYDSSLLQLQQQKQNAIDQANRDFQQKLLDINNNRAQVSSAKAQARLGALQDLRNQVYSINQQNAQFTNTLNQQNQQAQQQLAQYGAQIQSGVAGGQTAVNGFNPNIQSNMQTSGNQGQQANQSPLTGQISNTTKKTPYDQLSSIFGSAY